LESQLLLAVDLGFCREFPMADVTAQIREVKSMLAGLDGAIQASMDLH
jgi:hypothetical protein